jgi:hypothetical protein
VVSDELPAVPEEGRTGGRFAAVSSGLVELIDNSGEKIRVEAGEVINSGLDPPRGVYGVAGVCFLFT